MCRMRSAGWSESVSETLLPQDLLPDPGESAFLEALSFSRESSWEQSQERVWRDLPVRDQGSLRPLESRDIDRLLVYAQRRVGRREGRSSRGWGWGEGQSPAKRTTNSKEEDALAQSMPSPKHLRPVSHAHCCRHTSQRGCPHLSPWDGRRTLFGRLASDHRTCSNYSGSHLPSPATLTRQTLALFSTLRDASPPADSGWPVLHPYIPNPMHLFFPQP